MWKAEAGQFIGQVAGRSWDGVGRFCAIFSLTLMMVVAGCQRMMPLDTKPLDSAGMSYAAIKQLQALDITGAELNEIAKARTAGLSDGQCIEMVQLYHGRQLPFNAGDTVAGLLRARLSGETILELARLNELGINAGELQLIRLAGFSDAVVVEVARQEAAGKPVLSGASLSTMKNAGIHESMLLELLRRGVPDSEAATIIAAHRRGARDVDVLRRYPAT
jgi:hypothetical protein